MIWLRIAAIVAFIVVLLLAPDPDRAYLYERDLEGFLDEVAGDLEGSLITDLSVSGEGRAAVETIEQVEEFLEDRLHIDEEGRGERLRVQLVATEKVSALRWTLGDNATKITEKKPASWVSLLPPFLAILIALLFQRTIAALALGVWLGATVQSGGNPFTGLWMFIREYVIQQALFDTFRIEIIGFVIGLVALIGVISRGGGVQGMMQVILKIVKTGRSAQLATYAMGLVIFFDDYANTIIVGNTMRPLTDKLKVAREKLAYIVDSTAAPVAGISILSTWVAYEVSLFAPQLVEIGIPESPYIVFARTIPYRFYSLFTLAFILLGILLRREFGPMLTAQRRAETSGEVSRPGSRPMISDAMTRVRAKEGIAYRWFNGFLPIAAVVFITLALMWRSGNTSLEQPYPLSGIFSFDAIRDVLAEASSTKAIAGGAWSGFFIAVILMLGQRLLTPVEVAKAAFSSTKALFFAIVILILAWCIGGVCHDMGTAYYLVALFKKSISPLLYPMILFIVSCLVSFSTGSSWSTMAIILPNAVLLAHLLGENAAIGGFGLAVISIGAVLEGSVFGDHCSPISDTTILSSVSSAADHIDHVRTQIPYAVTTMLVALIFGYSFATRGVPPWISHIAGIVVITMVLMLFGRRTQST